MRAMTWSGLVAVLVLAALAGSERLLRADLLCNGSSAIPADPQDMCQPTPDPDLRFVNNCSAPNLPGSGHPSCENTISYTPRQIAWRCTPTLPPPGGDTQCITSGSGVCYVYIRCELDMEGKCVQQNVPPQDVSKPTKATVNCDETQPPPPGGA